MIFTNVTLCKNTTRDKTLKFQKDNFEALQKNRDTITIQTGFGKLT